MNDLNKRDSAVYDYIVKTASKSIPPTVREICAATGISSTSQVYKALKNLEDVGLIKRDIHSSRSISLAHDIPVSRVPIVGKVTAGLPILAVEQIEGYLPYPYDVSSSAELFALRVSGMSMKNAGIFDGDIVIADRAAATYSGDIIIALIDDEATVKRLRTENGRPVLYPENPEFSPIYPNNLEILGKVVGCFKKF